MDIQIRRAATDDYDEVCELYEEIDTLHRAHLPQLFQEPGGPARQLEYFQGLLADENTCLFVALVDEEIVGLGLAFVRDAPDIPLFTPRRYAVVDSVVVKSGYQKRGIGGQLMESMQAWAAARGASSIELNVYEFNHEAISFYKGLGFQALSRKMSKDL